MYKCPKCGDKQHIDIEATVRVRLIQHEESDDIETDADEADDRSHEWDDSSYCICAQCGHREQVMYFDTEYPFDEAAPDTRRCTCADQSWYGPEHGSQCDFAGEARS